MRLKINWKLRVKNKATLAAIASATVVFAAQLAQALGITLPVSQDQALGLVTSLLTVLAALGIVVDPTTDGLSDSEAAMGYEEPRQKDAK